MMLYDGDIGKEYIIKNIIVDDKELEEFLFSLGCYIKGKITLINKKSNNVVVSIKGARYNIDKFLANSIVIEG